jgi:hypothetical protein
VEGLGKVLTLKDAIEAMGDTGKRISYLKASKNKIFVVIFIYFFLNCGRSLYVSSKHTNNAF